MEIPEIIAWLKSLRPQPKVEWSEEIAILEGYIVSGDWSESHKERALDILKSLRSRPKSSDNWKPSEEQMKALWKLMHYAVSLPSWSELEKEIESLYKDLIIQ